MNLNRAQIEALDNLMVYTSVPDLDVDTMDYDTGSLVVHAGRETYVVNREGDRLKV